MGTYLSHPVKEKISEAGENETLAFGETTMQGWRLNQEDAHNCILHLDHDCSMFAVYDGHGGPEVSEYAAKNLANFIKLAPSWSRGDVGRGLIEAFLNFDQRLTTTEVLPELQTLRSQLKANNSISDRDDDGDRADDSNCVPFEKLMERLGIRFRFDSDSSFGDDDVFITRKAIDPDADEKCSKCDDNLDAITLPLTPPSSPAVSQSSVPVTTTSSCTSSDEQCATMEVENSPDRIDPKSNECEEMESDPQAQPEADLDSSLCGDMPGYDSGTTACVAIIKGNTLYVANAGDSRCVLSRNGTAIDMSVDHKPEDQLERDRIEKAGGRVTPDGRVNGGLNLSRAFGDHSYKKNSSLSPEEQMISAFPDLRVETLTPDDKFLIVACDGIWNSMTSQELVDFVSLRLGKGSTAVQVCEEVCDTCLSPSTIGDGTGCDNMTIIIVVFKDLAFS